MQFLVTYRLIGEPERQSMKFDDEEAMDAFVSELNKSPALDDYSEGITKWKKMEE